MEDLNDLLFTPFTYIKKIPEMKLIGYTDIERFLASGHELDYRGSGLQE